MTIKQTHQNVFKWLRKGRQMTSLRAYNYATEHGGHLGVSKIGSNRITLICNRQVGQCVCQVPMHDPGRPRTHNGEGHVILGQKHQSFVLSLQIGIGSST